MLPPQPISEGHPRRGWGLRPSPPRTRGLVGETEPTEPLLNRGGPRGSTDTDAGVVT